MQRSEATRRLPTRWRCSSLFAFLAGAGTALSPCVLPVLPALLSAGATGGRRRPLGIVLGLAITFTVTIVGLATVVDGVGPGRLGGARTLAIVVARRRSAIAIAVPPLADAPRGAAQPPRAPGPAQRGRRLRLGRRSSAARSASSTRRAPGRSSPPSSRSAPPRATPIAVGLAFSLGSAARPARARARRPRAGRPRARGRPRPRPAARARRRDDRHRASRWPPSLDVRFQSAIADHLPAVARQPDASRSRLARRRQAASTTCAGRRSFAVAAGAPGRPIGAPAAASARRPTSSATSAGSTRRAAAAEPREPARQRRARRLLDLHVHQLPAHAAATSRRGTGLPRATG